MLWRFCTERGMQHSRLFTGLPLERVVGLVRVENDVAFDLLHNCFVSSKRFYRSTCSEECGGGEQLRTRNEQSGTTDGARCVGDTEIRMCNTIGCRT